METNTERKQTRFTPCFITDGEKKSFHTLVSAIESFENISGPKQNKDKCTVLIFRSQRNTQVNVCEDNTLIGRLINLPHSA